MRRFLLLPARFSKQLREKRNRVAQRIEALEEFDLRSECLGRGMSRAPRQCYDRRYVFYICRFNDL